MLVGAIGAGSARAPEKDRMPVVGKLYRLLVLALLLRAAPAGAFVLETVDVGGQRVHPRWPAAALPVAFVVNERSLELLPNLAANSVPLAAIEAAMRAWSVPPVALRLAGTSSSAELARDGINLITFADTPRNRAAVGNFWASTTFWTARPGSQVSITEADVVLNSQSPFATDGDPNARDIQDMLTHELGHALGLEHSPIAAATMYPFGVPGQTSARSLETDDLAGLRALYGGDPQPGAGAIAGRVTTAAGTPVCGAHVVATDADGIARVGALTEPDGSFTLPSLPAGDYQVYAEPLDGPVTPASFSGGVFDDAAHPFLTGFRTAFAGAEGAPAARVRAGVTTALEPIRVEAQPASLDPQFIAWSPDGRSFSNALARSLSIASGRDAFLALLGAGLGTVPADGFRVSGSDVAVATAGIVRGAATNGVPFVILPLSVRSGARPGARSLYAIGPAERAVFTGALEIVSP
jgi:Carboxypeptidase regulatory-like domain/Matrixin